MSSRGETGYALKGTYKPASDGRGFGFIDCAETREYFGRDVYVNKDVASTLSLGQLVRFNAFLNRDMMPNVQDLDFCDETWEPEPADLSQSRAVEVERKGAGKGSSKGAGKWSDWSGEGSWWPALPSIVAMPSIKGKGFAKGGKGWMGAGGGVAKPMSKPTPTGKAYTGLLRSFNEANNYGFIECEEVKAEYGYDVFVHGKELSGQQVGDTLYFEVGLSAKGQPQALNVQSIDAAGSEPPAKRMRFDVDAGIEEAGEVAESGDVFAEVFAEDFGEGFDDAADDPLMQAAAAADILESAAAVFSAAVDGSDELLDSEAF